MATRSTLPLVLAILSATAACGGKLASPSSGEPNVDDAPYEPGSSEGWTSPSPDEPSEPSQAPPPQDIWPSTQCGHKPLDGETVHACAFPADVAVVGVTPTKVAILSRIRGPNGQGNEVGSVSWVHLYDRDAEDLEKLLRTELMSSDRLFAAFSPEADSLVWMGTCEASTTCAGIQRINITSRERSLLADNWTGPNLVTSATNVYWDGWDGTHSGVFAASLDAATPTTKRSFALYDGLQDTLAFAAKDGFVYFFAEQTFKCATLYRQSENGGAAEVLANDVPMDGDVEWAWNAAVDDDGSVIYSVRHTVPKLGFEIVRVQGGTKTTLAECLSEPTSASKCPEPAWLALHGNEIFVGKMAPTYGSWNGLVRLPKTAVGSLTPGDVANASIATGGVSLAPPVFEGDDYWLGYKREDSPYGIVVSRTLPPKP